MNYKEFVKDYNNPNITTYDVMQKHGLNTKKYMKIRKKALENNDIPIKRHMNTTGAKFYVKLKTGEFLVRKTIAGETKIIGGFKDEKTAQLIVELCKQVNWDTTQIQHTIDLYKVKPANYTKVNGEYIIQKKIDGKQTLFCKLTNKWDTIRVRDLLKLNEWDKNKLPQLLDNITLLGDVKCV